MTDVIYMLVNSICIITLCIILINTIRRQQDILKEIDKLKNEK